MGIAEKIANAKPTNWLAEGISDAEIKTTIELAKVAARIERCKLEGEMEEQEFAECMGE